MQIRRSNNRRTWVICGTPLYLYQDHRNKKWLIGNQASWWIYQMHLNDVYFDTRRDAYQAAKTALSLQHDPSWRDPNEKPLNNRIAIGKEPKTRPIKSGLYLTEQGWEIEGSRGQWRLTANERVSTHPTIAAAAAHADWLTRCIFSER
jgi:hypothetical protein